MINQVQAGKALNVVAPGGGFTSGTAYLVGGIFGVAATTVLATATGVLWTEGVFTLTKVSAQAWAVGDVLYWDNSGHQLSNLASAGSRVGVATAVAANPSATGNCKLDGIAVPPASGVVGLVSGRKIASGSGAALDASNPTPIATGLATIVYASVQLRGTAAPGDNTSLLTIDYTGSDGTLNVYGWKNTGGTDPTLVASTGTEQFDWFAYGT